MERKKWWKESIVYQIYPRGFKDSNGDGTGDINGITEKLDYIKDLGADTIWICPLYKSPWSDYGYDIADYYTVSEVFGTNEDLYHLIAKAKDKGIKILLDLVINHTSDEHAWFQEALKDPNSKYRDYYYFKEGNNGQPPNNWRSYFGGSAWEPVPNEENMYYLHAFTEKMPDLNWENPDMRQALYDMINWWLDKGIGGFRIDAILNIKKAMVEGNVEPDGDDGLVAIDKYIINQPGVGDLLSELKQNTFAKHDIMTIAEAGVPDEELEDFIGPDGYFDMCFDFRAADMDIPDSGAWYYPTDWTVNELRDILLEVQTAVQKIGWGAVYFENHDQNRSINKYFARNKEEMSDVTKKLLATILLGFRGTPVIYEGEEIGMENIQLDSIDQYEDVATHHQYHAGIAAGLDLDKVLELTSYRSRDNSRTPMQWNRSKHAGFTEGEPWFPVNPNYQEINVENALNNPDSVYYHYKHLLALRNNEAYKEVLVYGMTIPKFTHLDNIISYERVTDDKNMLILANFQNKEVAFDYSEVTGEVVSNNYGTLLVTGDAVTMQPYQAIIVDRSTLAE
nr:alpha-glucosidase [Gracilibacillus phocaeensis]